MKCRFMSVGIVMLLSSGCIFSHDERDEKHIAGDYYISYAGVSYDLIYKQDNASTQMLVVPTSVDSIGSNENYIFGSTNNRYFIVESKSHRIISEPATYTDLTKEFRRLGITNGALKKTNDL